MIVLYVFILLLSNCHGVGIVEEETLCSLIDRIEDQELLKEIAFRKDISEKIVDNIVDKIDNDEFLQKLAYRLDLSPDIVSGIVILINDVEILKDIYNQHSVSRIRRAAFSSLTYIYEDEDFYYNAAISTADNNIRGNAIKKIANRTYLMRIGKKAEQHNDSQTRYALIAKLGLSNSTKKCTNCNNTISVFSMAGENCPHCGVYWGDEKKTTTYI